MAQNVECGKFLPFDASGYTFVIVRAFFNADITNALLQAARDTLKAYRVSDANIFVYDVAGGVEIPVVLQQAIKNCKPIAAVVLGAIIRGETPHFDYVAKIVSEGTLRVALDSGVPVGFGVLTCEDQEQAVARTHVGRDAVVAALHSVKEIERMTKEH